MQRVLKGLRSVMPLLFAFGFVAPVIAQGIARLGWSLPFGVSALAIGLIVGGAWGLFAQIKGRWI